jgi:hypothetical protein
MKFIIDGDGTISYRAAYALLKDITAPYDNPVIITGLTTGSLPESVLKVLKAFEDTGYATWNQVPSVMDDFEMPGEKIYIILDPSTRQDKVAFCLDNNIPVLDLEKGLYPVRKQQ